MSKRLPLPLLPLPLLLLLGGIWLTRPDAPRASASAATDVIVVVEYPTCADGSQRGSSADCALYVVPGGPAPTIAPTATANPYYATAIAADGRSYEYYRGFTLADIYLASVATVGVVLGALYIVGRHVRGG